ncbi:MAG: hypothetical protein LBP51_06060 [Deferribacteraceae bacterium]|jgi:Mor family transcriptional regulator|nr:hypothetical protein [Deferribacteraceae bacterium]
MITLDDFPDNFRDIAEAIGVDAAVALCKFAGGTQVYIPLIVDRIERNQQLFKDYSAGKTFMQLAAKYNLSENTVRNIVFDLQRLHPSPTIEDFI